MVLHHIAQRASVIVKACASFKADGLTDGNLHMRNGVGVPERLEQHIRKSQRHKVLDSFLTQIMVNAESALFGEYRVDRVVDMARGGQVIAQRFFKANADIFARKSGIVQALDRRLKQRRRSGQEYGKPARYVANCRS